MENMENKNSCGCDCTMCHVGHHRRYRWLMILLGAVLAFGVGMKLGEIKGFLMSGGEYGGYRGERGGWMMQGYRGGNMMYYGTAPVQTTPATTTPTAPAKN